MNSRPNENQQKSDHLQGNRLSSNPGIKDLSGENTRVDYTELKYRAPENVVATKFAKGLGIFSIALGAVELLAPAALGQMIGLSDKYSRYLPLLGVREVAHGVAIMSQTKPTESAWSRVVGDGVDLAFLKTACDDSENNSTRLACATVAVLGVTALDILCASMLSKQIWTENEHALTPTTFGQTSGRQTY